MASAGGYATSRAPTSREIDSSAAVRCLLYAASMATTPVRLFHRGLIVLATPRRVTGGWSALVKVWQGRECTPVPFSGVYKMADKATGEGLRAGQGWIDERDAQRRLRVVHNEEELKG